MAKHKTVMATWLVSVLDQLVAQGLDRTALTAGLWGSDAVRITPTRQLELVLMRRLWQRAASLSPDPLLGLKVGAALPLQAMNIITLLIIHSANLREAIGYTTRYQQLVSNSGQLNARPKSGGILLHYEVTPCPVPMHHVQIESLFAGWMGLIKRCSRQPLVLAERITLISPRTDLQLAYASFFNCPVECGATINSIEFRADVLDASFPGADPSLLALLRGHAEVMLRNQNMADSLAASIRAIVATRGFVGISCDEVAGELGISTRTLQRRLAELRTTFRRLIEAARMEEALTLLSDGQRSMLEICAHLAYSEPSSFSHAIKAYWGVTPRELRHAGRPAGESQAP